MVQMNGRDLGLFTLSEAMNRAFLKRHFSSASGDLFEGHDEDINRDMELDSGPRLENPKELQELIASCAEPSLSKRWNMLQSRLDIDRFVTYAAMEVLICHHDGYCLDLNNYRVYFDPGPGRFAFIPHGMDLVFDRPTLPMETRWKGMVARSLMETVEGHRRYRDRLQQLAVEVFGGDSLVRRIDGLAEFIRPAIRGQGVEQLAAFDSAVAGLKQRVRERALFLLPSVSPVEK